MNNETIVTGSGPKQQHVVLDNSITVSGSDGAILDGADSNIKATVKDYTNSNPLAVVTVDTNGDYVSGSGGTQYTEDAAAAANPVGTALNLIRQDTLAGLTTDDGDNVAARGTDKGELYVKHVDSIPVTDNGGNLSIDDGGNSITVDNSVLSVVGGGTEATAQRVTIASDSTGVLSVDDNGSTLSIDDGGGNVSIDDGGNSITVDNGGTFAVQVDGNALTSLQLIDDPVKTDDAGFTPATDKVMMVGAEFDDSSPDSVDEGDAGALRMSGNRNLYVRIRDNAGNERGLNIDANGELGVSAIRSALPAGTNAIGKLSANSGVDIGDVDVTSVVPGTGATNLGKAEDGGHTTGDTGVFALAVRNDTPNTAVAGTDADYIQVSAYRTGAIRTAIPEEDFAALGSNHVKKYYSNTGAVTDGIVWSPAAGKRWYVTDLIFTTSAAATVTLEDDKAGGDETVFAGDFAANSGVSHHFATPLFSGEDAADLLVTTSAGNIKMTVVGYEI